MTMLELSSVDVVISGKPVLDGLSMTLTEQEVVGLIGAPGCGKSTLLNAVFGLARVSAGTIRYRDQNIANHSPSDNIRNGIVLVPQGGKVFRSLPVEENLYLAGYTLETKRTSARIVAIYEFFPRMKERRAQIAGSLSGGERQMLALGMGLMSEPKLLLLDEPSTGLSPLLTEKMLGEIKSLTKKLGCTVLLVEQNVKNAILISDRVLILRRGKIGYEYKVAENADPRPLLDAYAFKDHAEQETSSVSNAS
jgi:branched-chain amino acid transport system ATP-binding protein